MKVLAVLIAVVAMVALGLLAGFNRKVLRWIAIAIPLPMMKWPSLAVMLLSEDLYRGTARGMEVSLAYLLSFATMVALSFRMKAGKFFPDAGAVFFFLYWLFSLPSLANCHPGISADMHYSGAVFAWYEIWKVPMMYLIYRAVRGYCRFAEDVNATMLGIGVVAIVNFLSVLHQHFIVHVAQARGLFAHQNSMGMWALLAASMFFAGYLNTAPSRKWKFQAICFFCAACACMRTYSRGAMAALPVACFLILVVSVVRNFNFRIVARMVPLVAVLFVGSILAVPKIVERFEVASERSASKRVGLAKSAWNMVKDHPMAGVGLNNWGIKINPPYDYAVHRKEFGFGDDFKEGIVETIYLLVWAECGTPCFLALLAFFFWHWWTAWRLTGRLRGDPDFWIAAGAFGGLSGLYLQSVLEWVLKQSINFAELVMIFALISYLNEKSKEKSVRQATKKIESR